MQFRILSLIALGAAAFSPAAMLEIEQVQWLGQSGTSRGASEWGTARVTLAPSDTMGYAWRPEVGQYQGYLNITIQTTSGPQWVVRNVHLATTTPFDLLETLPTNYQIPLPVRPGERLSSAMVGMTITPDPLSSAPSPSAWLPVGSTDWSFGGFTYPVQSSWPPPGAVPQGSSADYVAFFGDPPKPGPMNANLPKKDEDKPGKEITIKDATNRLTKGERVITEKDVVKVKENICGCTAGACTRSLKYLQAWNPKVELPKPDDVDSVYKDMVEYLKTKEGNHGGTKFENILPGIKKYIEEKKVSLEAKWAANPDNALKNLDNGSDVTIHFQVGVSFRGKVIPIVAHSAFVVAMQEIPWQKDGKKRRAWKVSYLDDRNQQDKKADNNKHVLYVTDAGDVLQLDDKGLSEFAGKSKKVEFLIKRYVKPAP